MVKFNLNLKYFPGERLYFIRDVRGINGNKEEIKEKTFLQK